MANKYIKRCSTSHVVREMQVKPMKYYCTSIRRAGFQNTDNTKCWRGCEATKTHCLLGGVQNGTAPWEDSLVVFFFFTKLNILLPYNPVVMLLGIGPTELKTHIHTKTCTQRFITALLIISKIWKQPVPQQVTT